MKYQAALLSLILVISSYSRVGEASPTDLPLSYGFYTGPNYSQPAYSAAGATVTTNPRLGVNIGSYGDFPIFKWLFFRPELSLVQKGYNSGGGGRTELDYLEIPVSIVPRIFFKGGSMFFPVGLSYGLLVKREKISSNGTVQQIDTDHISLNEGCAQGGIGLELNFGFSWGMFFLSRYSYGLTNVGHFGTGGVVEDYKSRSLYALIGVFFVDRDTLDPTESRAVDYLKRHRGSSAPN